MKTAGAFPSSLLWYDSSLHFSLSPVASVLEMSSLAAGVKGSQGRATSLLCSHVIGYDRIFSCKKCAHMEVMALKPGGSSSNCKWAQKTKFSPLFSYFTFTEGKDQQHTVAVMSKALILGTLTFCLQKLVQYHFESSFIGLPDLTGSSETPVW